MRLDLYVSTALGLRKAAARDVIDKGTVTVEAEVVTRHGYQVILSVETVAVDGKALKTPFHRILMMHKPRDMVCIRQKGDASWCRAHPSKTAALTRVGDSSVFELLPAELDHPTMGCFGRLDKDTTGLLLFGTDGGLQIMMLHPNTKLPKSYIATLSDKESLADDAVQRFATGLVLSSGERCLQAKLEIIEQRPCGHVTKVCPSRSLE